MPSVADVSLRGLLVAQNVPLETSGDGDFLGLAEPVPVGTVLTVTVEGHVRTARVTQVVERELEHPSHPGVHLAWQGSEAKERAISSPKGTARAQAFSQEPSPEVVDDFHTTRYGEPPNKKRGSNSKKKK